MIKVAIVGNIAAGKSEVENILIVDGFKVFDSDVIAHPLLNNEKIIEEFKKFDVFENGKISRKKLGTLVFADYKLKQRLEKIIHPMIKNEFIKIFEQFKAEKAVFISVPLLFEAGMQDLFDKIIFIEANDNIRLERLMKRNNLSKEEALIRINSQLPQEEKIKFADFVIENNSNLVNLKAQILNLEKQIFSM